MDGGEDDIVLNDAAISGAAELTQHIHHQIIDRNTGIQPEIALSDCRVGINLAPFTRLMSSTTQSLGSTHINEETAFAFAFVKIGTKLISNMAETMPLLH